jgi:hypothetical protein
VLRLVRVLREQPGAEVFVRHDQRRVSLARGETEQAGGHLIEDGLEVEWGSWTYLQALLRGLRRINDQVDPDWTVVLSGQDYPLGHHRELESFLSGSGHAAHLAGFWELNPLELRNRPQDEFVLRHAYRHFELPWVPRRLPRRLAYRRELPPALRPQLGLRRLRTPDVRLHVSSDWPTLSRAAVRAVLGFAQRRPDVMRHLRRSFVPAESLFATALGNDRELSVGTGPHRYWDWPPGEAHPRVLTEADLPAALASGAHFARKFDTSVDSGVLDALDRARTEGSARASLRRPWPAET